MAGYKGTPTQYVLQATGHPLLPKSTLLYTFTLRDQMGLDHKVKALGIDMITDTAEQVDLSTIQHIFPEAPEEVWKR